MHVKISKCFTLSRDDSQRNSLPQTQEVTEGALKIWRTLPVCIRQDPCFESFRQEDERLRDGALAPENIDNVIVVSDDHHSAEADLNVNVIKNLEKIQVTNARDVENNIDDQNSEKQQQKKIYKYLNWLKILLFLLIWCALTAFLISNDEYVEDLRLIIAPKAGSEKAIPITMTTSKRVGLILNGPFLSQEEMIESNVTALILRVRIQRHYFNASYTEFYFEDAAKIWQLDLVNTETFDMAKQTKQTHTFEIIAANEALLHDGNHMQLSVNFVSTADSDFPLQIVIDESPIYKKEGVIYAALVLCGLYLVIIWEIVNRVFAAIIASTLSIGILAALNARPTMTTIMGWIDVETLLLLFGMMILVAILSETGVFDYLAVYAYKITNGHVWPLINCLCIFTAILSAFLDNVTTMLLIVPVTIRLCEVMSLNPTPILISMVMFSNIGGALTPVGDPPNVIIASNRYIVKNGVSFATFTLHMLPGVLLVSLQAYIQLRFKYRNISELKLKKSPEIEELQEEICVWKRAAANLSARNKDEELVRQILKNKVNTLKLSLKNHLEALIAPPSNYDETLSELQEKYPIRNKPLLLKSSVAFIFVMALFFMHSQPELQGVSLGWTAFLGALLLVILADIEYLESVLVKVEWTTLLFFGALFILMEALAELGLIEWFGNMTENIIFSVGEESRLTVAILIIVWVSAIASAFVDNIPLTTMMVKVVISLAQNNTLNLPLQPLVWALAFGACLGGNGTIIGASANVVCAGVAEQHGYKFTFLQFFKVGFPVMICTLIVSSAYLIIAHVVFSWH